MSEQITDEFRSAMTQWVELRKQLTEARKDMKVLNQREKELKGFIGKYMESQAIDNVNLKKGKVAFKKVVKTGSMSKEAVKRGLGIYFDGDETRVERAMLCITDNLERTETSVISLKGA